MHEDPISVLDLFAGAGGLTAGFHEASPRFRTVQAVEMDFAAAASYTATFGSGVVYAGPIQKWLAEGRAPQSVDVIVGGPPCQGFSTLGRQDVQDERNALWELYAQTIATVRPKYFVVENVAAFAKSPQFEAFSRAIGDGNLQDYSFEHRILNAADYGAAQVRKRAVMIGHRKDVAPPAFPTPTHSGRWVTVAEALSGVPVEATGVDLPPSRSYEFAGRSYAGSFSAEELHLGRTYSELSLKRFAHIPEGGNRFDIPHDLLAPCWQRHTTGTADVMGRLRWDKPSVTIRTEFFKPEKGRYLHPVAPRALTHYEAALLQGFPSTHRFVGSKTAIARQIGNAVPIPLAKAIALELERLL
ncbi:DNA (cytosine-5)-methyltransferase 1 [Diaminobutyricimonas aerilata]|uniref:Cytosine-specific methyltransferase n=1 Tax=Diaminobutyricimonas aerilata TaxID=1162967 RepID=A0A2M9CM28_9MICO|nr:DNA cytosine methyltransferase [Diaminobutyricimonas aerilata]PJJ72946.1 DNA (cytosine-5)-methyltransferase 1 [Diaminobutyricimonas aerilata]